MHNKNLLLFIFSSCFLFLQAQVIETPNFWTPSSDLQYRSSTYERQIVPDAYVTFDLDYKAFEKQLAKALPNTYSDRRDQKTTVYLPNPKGELEEYTVWRDNLLPKKLNARYPEISTYAGHSTTDPHKKVKFDFTSKGFRAISKGLGESTYYIDPIAKGVTNSIISYYKKDYTSKPAFECLVDDAIKKEDHAHDHGPQRMAGDCNLHTFELALACTGEYATFHGGTKSSVMAEYTTSINRVNLLYENEVGVRFVFVSNTDDLIFLDGTTDPYTNNSGTTMLNENQNTCDDVIGFNNYDIGHVYSTGGGGIAQLNSPCNNGKARGVTGLPSPVGDPFYIDYVSHEIGHQFGATHTYNNACGGNRTDATAYEPGSGSTIMSYAGICAPNVQFFADAYFHSASLVQMGNFISSTSCADLTTNGSDRPIIAPLQNYNIPIGTPFELTAEATVTDGSALSYCWEQMDREIANMPPETNATDGPMFRTWSPVASPSRVFPSINFLLLNMDNQWEVLPGATRELNFRVTVRATGGDTAGCTQESDLVLNSTSTSGPFVVLAPNTNVNWTVGETQTVVWDVANTTAPPVNCQNVNILLSIDGGFTYPISLLENTPNIGQADITVPNFPGFQTRVRVQGANNVFFDISNENFSIVEPTIPTFTLSAQPKEQSVCGNNAGTVSYEINSTSLAGFDDPVQYSVSGLPVGMTADFDNNNSIPTSTVTLQLNGLENVSTGNYTFTVQANGGGQSDEVELNINVVDSAPEAVNLILPIDAASDVDPSSALTWDEVDFADGYLLEISTDASFNTIVYSTSIGQNNAIPEGLTTSTIYYWRVKSTNICGDGPTSQVYRFRTATVACDTYTNDNNVTISTSAGTISSTITVPNGASIQSVTLSTVITHSWIGDIDGTLTSPQGNAITVFERPGIPGSDFGCRNDNIRATFDDNASNDADDFDSTCGTDLYAIDGTYQPIELFDNLSTENSSGDWIFQIQDYVDEDGGALNSWTLEICTNSGTTAAPVIVNNNTLSVLRSNMANITSNELSYSGTANNGDISYTLITLPNEGTLMRSGAALQVGDQFTQAEINNTEIVYNHNGTPAMTDSFMFDVEEIDGGWAPNNIFQIEIIENSYTAITTQTANILCFGGNEGSISVTTDGGAPPFMYSLDGVNFQSENSFTGLIAGEYTATVIDNDQTIVSSNTVIINQPDQLLIDATVNENTVSLSATGGTGTLEYSLDNNSYQTSNVFTNLANGNYIFYVRDANGCIANTETISLSVNDLMITASITAEVSCHDGMDGQITAAVTGGTAPFTYTLNGQTVSNSNVFSNLSAGQYTIEVTDANLFTATSNTITISNPIEIMISAVVDRNNITLSATGGTGVYQYSLNNQNNYQNNPSYEGLANGEYIVYAIDQNGCSDETMLTINYEEVSLSTSILRPIFCHGDMNGIVEVNTNSGIGPFQYAVNNGAFQNSNIFQNLGAGNYTFRVLDSFSDETIIDLTLEEPTSLSVSVDTDQGTANLQGIGGTPPYAYALDNSTFQTSGVFENLIEGPYEATVIDANECIATFTFMTSINDLVASTTQLTDILCAGDQTASISVAASQGTAPYEYSLDGSNFQDENSFENLDAGQYTITIRDADDFMTTTDILINEPEALSISVDVSENSITINAMGGTGNLSYSIDNQDYQASNSFSNLSEGNYTAFVIDENGCIQTSNFSINASSFLVLASVSKPISCFDESDGGIVVETSGGTNPKEYSLDGQTFQSSNFFDNLSAGTYTVTVRDANGTIVVTNMVTLENPDAIAADLIINQNNLTINASGGTGDYTYSIDGTAYQNANQFNQLDNGNYTVYILDSNECLYTEDFSIDFETLSGVFSITEENLCAGDMNGAITITAVGGVAPYVYSISGSTPQNSNVFTGLGAGVYDIIIQDAAQASFVINDITILAPAPLSLVSQSDGNQITLTAQGGTTPYQYSLDDTIYQEENIFIDLDNGDYTAYVQDANGCTSEINFTIDVVGPLSINLAATESLDCSGLIAGSISATATGGRPPYLYSLDNGPLSTENEFENLPPGQYQITVQDALLNQVSGLALLTAPDPLEMDILITDNEIEILIDGGIAPYSYSTDGGQAFSSSQFFTDLEVGEYTVIVEDANGCFIEEIIVISSVSISPIDHSLILDLAPNPASELTYLSIGTQAHQEINISLIDILGRTVKTYKTDSSLGMHFPIDISNVPLGTYLIRLDVDDQVAVRKLIIE